MNTLIPTYALNSHNSWFDEFAATVRAGSNVIDIPAHVERGRETAAWVLDQITAYPESHDQATWGCGTTACVGGWAAVLHLDKAAYHSVAQHAMLALGLSPVDAATLFYSASNRTAIAALTDLVEEGKIDWASLEVPVVATEEANMLLGTRGTMDSNG